MNLIPVSSSSIAAIGYDPDAMILRIAFHAGGVYDYHAVPEFIAHQLMAAPSKGKYYATNIKGRFNPIRIR